MIWVESPRQLACCNCATGVSVAVLIVNNVSPDRTVCVTQPGGGPQTSVVGVSLGLELGWGEFPVGIRAVSVGGAGVGVEGGNVRVGIRVEVLRPSRGLDKNEPALAVMARKIAPVRIIIPTTMKRLICQRENCLRKPVEMGFGSPHPAI